MTALRFFLCFPFFFLSSVSFASIERAVLLSMPIASVSVDMRLPAGKPASRRGEAPAQRKMSAKRKKPTSTHRSHSATKASAVNSAQARERSISVWIKKDSSVEVARIDGKVLVAAGQADGVAFDLDPLGSYRIEGQAGSKVVIDVAGPALLTAEDTSYGTLRLGGSTPTPDWISTSDGGVVGIRRLGEKRYRLTLSPRSSSAIALERAF